MIAALSTSSRDQGLFSSEPAGYDGRERERGVIRRGRTSRRACHMKGSARGCVTYGISGGFAQRVYTSDTADVGRSKDGTVGERCAARMTSRTNHNHTEMVLEHDLAP